MSKESAQSSLTSTMREVHRQAHPISSGFRPVLLRRRTEGAPGDPAEVTFDILTAGTDGTLTVVSRDAASSTGWAARTEQDIKVYELASAIDFSGKPNGEAFGVVSQSGGQPHFAVLSSDSGGTVRAELIGQPITTYPAFSGVYEFEARRMTSAPAETQFSATVARGTGVDPLTCVNSTQLVRDTKFKRPLWLWKLNGGTQPLLTTRHVKPLFDTGLRSGPQQRGLGWLYATLLNNRLTVFADELVSAKKNYDYDDITQSNNSQIPTVEAENFAILEHPQELPEILAQIVEQEAGGRQVCKLGHIAATSQRADGSLVWGDWKEFPMTSIDGTEPEFIQMRAVRLARNAPIFIFGIDTDIRLWEMRQDASGQWLPPALIDGFAVDFSIGYAGTDPSEATSLRLILSKGNALAILRREDSGDWTREEVEVEDLADGHFDTLYDYTTTLTVRDPAGLPNPGAQVLVLATDEGRYLVNGRFLQLSSDRGTPVTADAMGHVTVIAELDQQLGAPTFTFMGDQIPGGQMTAKPNAMVADTFARVTADTLRDATDPATGQSLLPTSADAMAEGIANSLNEVAKAAMKMSDFVPTPTPFAARNPPPAPVAPSCAPQGFQIEFGDGQIHFRALEQGEFDAMAARCNLSPDRVSEDALGSFIHADWGGIWQGFRQGLIEIARVTIEGGMALIEIAGQCLHFVFDTVRKAFDVVLAVLETVGVKFGSLVGWLLKTLGFFVDWTLVLDNRDVIKERFCASMLSLANKIPDAAALQSKVNGFFDRLDGDLSHLLDGISSVVGMGQSQTVGSAAIGHFDWSAIPDLSKLPSPFDLVPNFQWVLDELNDALGRASRFPAFALPNAGEALDGLVMGLKDEVKQDISTLLSGAKERASAWFSDPTAIQGGSFTTGFSDVLIPAAEAASRLGRELSTGALDIASAFAAGRKGGKSDTKYLLDALDEAIHLPFFSAFYTNVQKTLDHRHRANALSLLDLTALVLALPATLVLGDLGKALGPRPQESSGALTQANVDPDVVGLASAAALTEVIGTIYSTIVEGIALADTIAGNASNPSKEKALAVASLLSLVLDLMAAGFGIGATNEEDGQSGVTSDYVFWADSVGLRTVSTLNWVVSFRYLDNPAVSEGTAVIDGLVSFLNAALMFVAGGLAADKVRKGNASGKEREAEVLGVVSLFMSGVSSLLESARLPLDKVIEGKPTPPSFIAAAVYLAALALLNLSSTGLSIASTVVGQMNENEPSA